ncbi:MAG: hypothetical protein Q4A98_05975 [Comamonadaceae bacterium]|nr:hypothetical protein [Comamonadaceae bacterium]
MSNHTTGPWFASGNQVYAKKGDRIAYMAECDEQALADVRLIAAAPEMLHTLQDILATYNDTMPIKREEDIDYLIAQMDDIKTIAAEVIKKATGVEYE